MSTRPIAHRRLRPVYERPAFRRLILIGAIFAAVFAAAFVLGRTRDSGAASAGGPPALPTVRTPVPAALSFAPAIEIGVLERPLAPARETHSSPILQAPTTDVEPVRPAATPTVQAPAPAPTVTAPAQTAPTPSTGGGEHGSGSKSGGGGSGQGTSFESSE